MAIAAIRGRYPNTYCALAVVSWPKTFTALARSQTLAQRRPCIHAAILTRNSSRFQILVRHVLPNMIRTGSGNSYARMEP